MLVRVVRAVLGTTLLLVGLPLLLAGGVLWFATQHQDPAGGYSARLSTVATAGHALVASDVDALLRREAPFARGGRTTLRLTAQTADGPAFVGLAPAPDVARYLAGVPHQRVEEVRLARGPLPVVTSPVGGVIAPLGPPAQEPFWLLSSSVGLLEWSPQELRDQRLAIVVMAPDASAPLIVDMTARVQLRWLDSTTYALLVLGTLLPVAGVTALVWPGARREVVYVVPPGRVPEVAAHLGIPLPGEDADIAPSVAASPPSTARPIPPPDAGPPPPALAVSAPTGVASAPAVPTPLDAGFPPPRGLSLADLPPLEDVSRLAASLQATQAHGGVGAPPWRATPDTEPELPAVDTFQWPPPVARPATATPVSVPPAANP